MGDNRPYSGDSRDFGPIPAEAIEGKITPPGR
jgi:type IV secretory pathway protease TraF